MLATHAKESGLGGISPDHLYLYSPSTLLHRLEKCGYDVVFLYTRESYQAWFNELVFSLAAALLRRWRKAKLRQIRNGCFFQLKPLSTRKPVWQSKVKNYLRTSFNFAGYASGIPIYPLLKLQEWLRRAGGVGVISRKTAANYSSREQSAITISEELRNIALPVCVWEKPNR